ncbi:MAG: 50S ribosomal protein L1 [Nanoarchaeota archaeon]|nr:50S ribosomal protein L1 [Nanoarchaeota archaeon]
MDKKEIINAIKQARKETKPRKFSQSFDLIINLRNLDLKKNQNQVDDFVELHYTKGKKIKVCALVGTELEAEAKKVCDKTIRVDEFTKLDKKEIKKIGAEHDYFIAQANIMPKVAASFGRVLGPHGKMPNPKAGCVVSPKANLQPLYDKLQKFVKLTTKKGGSVKSLIGIESMKDEEIADNILVSYQHFIHILPQGDNNVKNVMVKLTMGKPCKIGAQNEAKVEDKKGKTKSTKKVKAIKKEEPVSKEKETVKAEPKKAEVKVSEKEWAPIASTKEETPVSTKEEKVAEGVQK